MDAAAELGRDPVSKHQIQPEYGHEQADAGRDCRTRLARPKFSGANEDRKILFFPGQLTKSRIDKLTRLIHTLAMCVTLHRSEPRCAYPTKNLPIYFPGSRLHFFFFFFFYF